MVLWALVAALSCLAAAIVMAGLRQERRRRSIAADPGDRPMPDRCLSHEIDHQLPGVLNWTFRDGTFQARRRPEDSW